MATPLIEISEGRTKRLVIYVETKLEGASTFTRESLAGISVVMGWSRSPGGVWTPAPGAFTKDADQATYPAKCYYTPADVYDFVIRSGMKFEDFLVRTILTDGSGKILPAPSGAAAIIRVHRK